MSPHSLDPRKARPQLGMGLAVLAYLALPLIDLSAKQLTTVLPHVQIVWMRFLVQLVLAMIIFSFARQVRPPWRTAFLPRQLMRGGLMLCLMLLNVEVIAVMPLTFFSALFYTAPFWVTIFAYPLLGERAGWRRWSAMIVGFCGVLLILQPGEGFRFDAIVIFALLSPMCFALFSILNRQIAQRESFATMLFYMALVGTVGLAPSAIDAWVWPENWQIWLLLFVPGVISTFGHGLLIIASRYTEAGILAPFIYLEMFVFILADTFIFQDTPPTIVFVGTAIICSAGVYIWLRERKLGIR